MTEPQAAPYETLARIAERELEVLASGRLDELERLAAEREALLATLPETPPACARPALERAALTQKRVTMEIVRRREAIVLELAQLEQARRLARGYAPPRGPRSSFCANA
jgi:flagellar biosynthesis/type III secretory pathway chaperone